MADEKNSTKERLKSYIFLRREVDNQLERLSRMKSDEILPGKRESDGSKHTASGSDRMANAIVRRLQYEDKILDEVERKMDEMDTITNAIDRLSDSMEREVLRMRYIDCQGYKHTPWREIALDMYGDDDEAQMQMVFRIHGRALQNIEEEFSQ